MAKQAGVLKITGCYDDVCFYKMDGKYFARVKSSLTGKRVKKDPAFKRTMEHAGLLARASKIASLLYKALPQEKKEKGAYKKLVGQVMRLLKEGKTREDILLLLLPAGKKPKTFIRKSRAITRERINFGTAALNNIFFPIQHKIKNTACQLQEAPA